MYSKLRVFLLLSTLRCVAADSSHPLMQYIVEYMRENLSTYQVTVVVNSTSNLGPLGSDIVKIMIDEFSSVVINANMMEKQPVAKRTEDLWDRTADQSKLKIGIMDLRNDSESAEVVQNLSGMMQFFMRYSELVRGKVIIFLINGDGGSLEIFFKYAWNERFLDITVIEWMVTAQKRTLAPNIEPNYEAFIHTYNPFQDKYERELLTPQIDILPDKLKNLHGYQLHTDMRELDEAVEIDAGYTGPNVWDGLSGYDVYRTKILSETLNFEAVPWIITPNGTLECIKIECDTLEYGNASHQQTMDFFSNSIYPGVIGKKVGATDYINMMKIEISDLQTPDVHEARLCLIQRKTLGKYDYFDFLASCAILFAIAWVFYLSSKILGLDQRIWSYFRITQTLIGDSVDIRRSMSSKEKSFLLALYFVSISTMLMASNEVLKLNLSRREILRFKTLEELADSGVSLRVTKDTRDFLLKLGQQNPTLQKIANQSVASEQFDPKMYALPVNETEDKVYGVLIQYVPKVLQVGSANKIWFYTVIEENIMSYIPTMKLATYTPFKERFGMVLQKLTESGLMSEYNQMRVTRGFRSLPSNERTNSAVFYPHHTRNNDRDIEMPLHYKLAIILSVGYSLAWAALAWEYYSKKRSSSIFPKLSAKSMGSPNRRRKQAFKMKLMQRMLPKMKNSQHSGKSASMKLENKTKQKVSRKADLRNKNVNKAIYNIIEDVSLFGLLELDNAELVRHLNRKRRFEKVVSNFLYTNKVLRYLNE
ncbi:hypothetical protein QAD02_010780 [Eretmocerus hayati]|uniref:Uncharacterized protein n=1 Tax=Eretmocerus hayati TaxID=131215 RepID=A0ACC2NUR4_9HYME|nr:hypothetical protein QAD02_010780 [Eretmocerus hayati]